MERAVQNYVAVIGAGSAGLFGAFELASQGAEVVIFHRDIKPGGWRNMASTRPNTFCARVCGRRSAQPKDWGFRSSNSEQTRKCCA
jgi:cation diffusion facilitator CzcD-associated flavoprotein CzcO